MKNSSISEIKLGAFILVALLLFLGAIYYIGDQSQLFGSDIRIKTVFNNVSGLQIGNNVRLSGIKVGTVYELKIISDSSVSATMLIEKNAAKYIKSDAYATIESEGLMGNKVIAIKGGSVQSPVIEDGAEIASRTSVSIDAAIETFALTASEVQELVLHLQDITKRVNSGEGLLGKLIADTVLEEKIDLILYNAEKSSEKGRKIIADLEETTDNINHGEGLIARLLYDTSWTSNTDRIVDSLVMISGNITSATRNLRVFTKDLNAEHGTLHMLLTDSAISKDVKETIEHIRQGSDDLEGAVKTLENSWILNLFSKKNKEENTHEEQ